MECFLAQKAPDILLIVSVVCVCMGLGPGFPFFIRLVLVFLSENQGP